MGSVYHSWLLPGSICRATIGYVTIQEAQDIPQEYTKNPNLIKHAQAVSAVMRFYAQKFHEDEEVWGITGLLHDFDYEIHPTMADHPMKDSSILRERGVSNKIIHGIMVRASFTGEPRDTLMKKITLRKR